MNTGLEAAAMNRMKIGLMWCFVVISAVMLITNTEPDTNDALPSGVKMPSWRVTRIQGYGAVELIVIAELMIAGYITIRYAAGTGIARPKGATKSAAPQEDAKPSLEPPLLVLTDKDGKYIV
jgi:hypothetical protein